MLKTLSRWMALQSLRKSKTKTEMRQEAKLWRLAGHTRLAEELRKASKEL